MRIRPGALLGCLTILCLVAAGWSQNRACEGALPILPDESPQLYGMTTPAGSGRHLDPPTTRIVRVTNLNDAGPGSLRDAIEGQTGPRTIVFEVSGNIPLERRMVIGSRQEGDTRGQYITIAGQTAPSPGITVQHYGFYVEANSHDVLIQHLRIRTGDTSLGGVLDAEWTRVGGAASGVYAHPVRVQPNRGWGSGIGVKWKGKALTEVDGRKQNIAPGEWDWHEGVLYVNVGQHPLAGEVVWIPSKTHISDPLTLSDKLPSPRHIVVDHCSFSWGGDMTVQNGADNATFLHCILTEALNHPRHPKGPHSKGFYNLSYNRGKGGQHVAFVKNMLSHSRDRNPAISSGSAIVVNSFFYDLGKDGGGDHGIRGEDTSEKKGPVQVSVVANVIERTDRAPRTSPICFRSRWDLGSKFYISEDNMVDGKLIQDPWNNPEVSQMYPWPKVAPLPANKRAATAAAALWPAGYKPMPVTKVKAYVLKHAGARPADRDPVDKRVVQNVHDRVAHLIASQEEVGGWPALAGNRRALTIPENPHGDDDSDGYTNLENWLHGYAAEVEGANQ